MQRIIVIALIAMVAAGAMAHAADDAIVYVKKTASCGCCGAWVKHLHQSGFKVATEDVTAGALMRFKLDNGVSPKLAACHTGRVQGYTIEGHVPAKEVARLLKERPEAVGLTVPGMPIGSPGMESGDRREKYEVLLIKKDGTTKVFATYDEVPKSER